MEKGYTVYYKYVHTIIFRNIVDSGYVLGRVVCNT